jgi:membrane peptidoglycan carboxypeptidase
VLQKIPSKNGRALGNGRDAIGKTGTWEYKDGKTGENGDAWMVGATRKIAASVWIGREQENKKTKQMQLLPIKKPGGGNMTGGSTPGEVWKKFMDAASEAINAPDTNFLPNAKVGNPEMKGNGLDPLPPPPEQNDNGCLIGGLICPPDQNGNNNGGDNNGGNNNGGPNNGGPNNGGQTQQPNQPTLPTTLPGAPDGGGGGQNDND